MGQNEMIGHSARLIFSCRKFNYKWNLRTRRPTRVSLTRHTIDHLGALSIPFVDVELGMMYGF